ncbi:hypothetical protein [uncultured Ramlibacter sp.]|nr:hypothetical protein [uncultured Ramlibacter sp.]
MNVFVLGHWWIGALRRLPLPVKAALDAWSHRLARQSAEKRRRAASASK